MSKLPKLNSELFKYFNLYTTEDGVSKLNAKYNWKFKLEPIGTIAPGCTKSTIFAYLAPNDTFRPVIVEDHWDYVYLVISNGNLVQVAPWGYEICLNQDELLYCCEYSSDKFSKSCSK